MDLATSENRDACVSSCQMDTSRWFDKPIASWGWLGITKVDDVQQDVPSWRYGAIHTHDGKLTEMFPRWWPCRPSLMTVWIEQRIRFVPPGHCWLYYSQPRSTPGYIALNYARTGVRTPLSTVYRALSILDDLARLLRAKAIVCHASNNRLTDAMMRRNGFQRHAKHLPGYHYIKRFTESTHDGVTYRPKLEAIALR